MIRLGLYHCVRHTALQNGSLHQIKSLPQLLQSPKKTSPIVEIVRTSFFGKKTAEHLWKSVITVSNAGKKRGRGKGLDQKRSKNLNRGQIVGVGRANIYWPGLTGPVVKGSEILPQRQLEKDPAFMENIIKIRDSLGKKKRFKLHPLERGWAGIKMPGRKIGPPDATDDRFKNFESIVLEMRGRLYMTSNMGKKRKNIVTVVTGNKNGMVGIARITCNDARNGMNLAKNRAVKRLMFIKRLDDRTIYHDFCGAFHRTKVFVSRKYDGYGIIAHRAIKAIAECAGITDFHAKVEGSTNLQNIIKAFLSGLIQQKTYQEIANEKKLHVVRLRAERDFYPDVVASPDVVLTPEEARRERQSFQEYVHGNKVKYVRSSIRPHEKARGWDHHLRKVLYKRNHDKVELKLQAEYGERQSFYYDLYPECRKKFIAKSKEERENEAAN